MFGRETGVNKNSKRNEILEQTEVRGQKVVEQSSYSLSNRNDRKWKVLRRNKNVKNVHGIFRISEFPSHPKKTANLFLTVFLFLRNGVWFLGRRARCFTYEN